MSRRALRRLPGAPGAEDLLGLLAAVPESAVVGFQPGRLHVDLHLAPLPPDARAGAAGLFTMRADEEWSAVGAVLVGTARDTRTHRLISTEVLVRLVVTRAGHVASEMYLDGVAAIAPGIDPRTPEGIVVDALHRVLGLDSPGTAPPLATLVLNLWLDQVLESALRLDGVSWADAVALHPGRPGSARVGPSIETIVEATMRAAEELDWERMRRRAAAGQIRVADLTAREAAWMDPIMFGRWMVSSLPDPAAALDALRNLGAGEAADNIAAVVGAATPESPQRTDLR